MFSGIGINLLDSYEIDSLEEFFISKNDFFDFVEVEILGLWGGVFLNDSVYLFVYVYDCGVYGGGWLSVLEIKRVFSFMCLMGCSCFIYRIEGGRIDIKLKGVWISDKWFIWGDIVLNLNGNLFFENESDVSNVCGDMLRFVILLVEILGLLIIENMWEMN